MSDDKEVFDEIFSDGTPPDITTEVAPVEKEPEPKQEAAPVVEEKEIEPADTSQQEVEPAQETQKEPEHKAHMVPLPELIEERKARQALEKQAIESAAEFKAMKSQMQSIQNTMLSQQQQPQVQQEQIDPDIDPVGFWEQKESQMENRHRQSMFAHSEQMAIRQHGADLYNKAADAAQLAGIGNQIVNQPDPAGALVEWYQRQQTLEAVGGNLDAYNQKLSADLKEKLKAEVLAEIGASGVQVEGESNSQIPASITDTTATATNGTVVPSDMQVFNDIFHD